MKIAQENHGFTLIELLVVVATIGILAAIAIPQYASYRQRGFDARANSDLRSAAMGEEAYYASTQAYKSCASVAACQAALPGFFAGSQGVTMAMTNNSNVTFTGTTKSDSGSGKTFSWDSAAGGMI
jgi:prepilin-type N-terminal cleavage/methylation domain-containing protein